MRVLDLDRVLQEIGGFGKYQKTVYYIVCILISLSGPMAFCYTFIAAVPPHRCFVPNCDNENPRYSDAKDLEFDVYAYPSNHESCEVYKNESSACKEESFVTKESENCSRWIYDSTVYRRTIATEFDLVCDKKTDAPFIVSVFFAGQMAGLLPIGSLSDRFGRKICFFFSTLSLAMIGTLQALLANSYVSVLVFTFLSGFFQCGFFQLGFILGIEIVGKSKRLYCGIAVELFFVIGELYLALCAWLLRDWRWIVLSYSLPCFSVLILWGILAESPRWLLSKGRNEETEKILQRITNWNKATLPDLEDYYIDFPSSTDKEGIQIFCQSTILFVRLLMLSGGWFVISMCYYGLTIGASSLAGSIYLNFSLMSLVEIPGYILSYFCMQKAGRRPTMAGSLFISGLSIVVSHVLRGSVVTKILFLLSKMSVTCAFATVYLYTSELLPTSGRTVGMSVSSMSARVGGLVSPYIGAFGGPYIFLIAFGVTPLLYGFIFLLTPETLGKDLPDTVQRAENIGDASPPDSEINRPLLQNM